jgi:hypothetical protein
MSTLQGKRGFHVEMMFLKKEHRKEKRDQPRRTRSSRRMKREEGREEINELRE